MQQTKLLKTRFVLFRESRCLRIAFFQHRAYVAKMQPIWDTEKAEKANKANRENMIYLATATGTPIPADF